MCCRYWGFNTFLGATCGQAFTNVSPLKKQTVRGFLPAGQLVAGPIFDQTIGTHSDGSTIFRRVGGGLLKIAPETSPVIQPGAWSPKRGILFPPQRGPLSRGKKFRRALIATGAEGYIESPPKKSARGGGSKSPPRGGGEKGAPPHEGASGQPKQSTTKHQTGAAHEEVM